MAQRLAKTLMLTQNSRRGALKGKLFWDTVNLARAAGFELGELGVPEHRPEHVAAYFNESGGFVPSRLAEEILSEYDLVTLPGPVTYVYHPALGVYVDDGEDFVSKVVYAKLGEAFRGHRLNEVFKVVTIQSYTRQVDPVRPELVGVQNGILNVLTGELRPFTPDVFLTTKLPVAFEPDASSAPIEGFVAEVVSPEDGKVLQEFAGYCLYRGYPYAKAVVPYGRSRSGKSTFTAALTARLGSHNVVAVTLQDLVTDRFAAAHLYNKLGNFVPDLDDAEVKHEGIFKALTGGDLITAAKKFKDSFEFRNYAKMLYGCNRLPRVTDDKSEAFFHRLMIVNFRNQFIGDSADPGIIDKLTTPDALSGMLNWSIKGLQRLMGRGGFRESKNTAIAKEQYMAMQDTAKYFMDNHIERDAPLATPRRELYRVYSEFCKGLGAVPETAKSFNMLIADKLSLEVRRIQVEGERVRCWLGVKVVGGPLLDHTLTATYYRALESGYEAVTEPIGRGGIRF